MRIPSTLLDKPQNNAILWRSAAEHVQKCLTQSGAWPTYLPEPPFFFAENHSAARLPAISSLASKIARMKMRWLPSVANLSDFKDASRDYTSAASTSRPMPPAATIPISWIEQPRNIEFRVSMDSLSDEDFARFICAHELAHLVISEKCKPGQKPADAILSHEYDRLESDPDLARACAGTSQDDGLAIIQQQWRSMLAEGYADALACLVVSGQSPEKLSTACLSAARARWDELQGETHSEIFSEEGRRDHDTREALAWLGARPALARDSTRWHEVACQSAINGLRISIALANTHPEGAATRHLLAELEAQPRDLLNESAKSASPRASMISGPSLRLRVSLGDQWLDGGRSMPKDDAARAPLTQTAKLWLHAVAKAQRLLEDSGASELFAESGLNISIPDPRLDIQRLPEPASLLAFGIATPFSYPYPDMDSKVELGPVLEPGVFGERGQANHPEATVMLYGRTNAFDREKGMASTMDGWSDEEIADYTALHEIGHAAHMATPRGAKDPYGLAGASAESNEALAWLGLDGPNKNAFADQARALFGECYADCYAAILLGADDAEEIAKRAIKIGTFRARNAPAALSNYAEGDPIHDTREALASLRESLSGLAAPFGAEAINATCMEAAKNGLFRWCQSMAARPAELGDLGFWPFAFQAAQDSNRKLQADSLVGQFEELLRAAESIPELGAFAREARTQHAEADKPGLACGLWMLLLMNKAGGSPRIDPRGTLPEDSARIAEKLRLKNLKSEVCAPSAPAAQF